METGRGARAAALRGRGGGAAPPVGTGDAVREGGDATTGVVDLEIGRGTLLGVTGRCMCCSLVGVAGMGTFSASVGVDSGNVFSILFLSEGLVSMSAENRTSDVACAPASRTGGAGGAGGGFGVTVRRMSLRLGRGGGGGCATVGLGAVTDAKSE